MGKDAFLDFVGDTPNNRLMGFLLTGRDFDYSLSELARKAEIGWTTLHRIFPRFIKQKVVEQTRTVGRAKLYKLSLKNPLVQKYAALYDTIILQQLEKTAKKEENRGKTVLVNNS